MDVQLIHPSGEGPPPAITLEPLLDVVDLCGLLSARGLSVEVLDGSFEPLDRLLERVERSDRPRVAVVHAPEAREVPRRARLGVHLIERLLKEDDRVVVAFGPGARQDPVAHLEAGADVVAGHPEAVPLLLDALDVRPSREGPARMAAVEALVELPDITWIDGEGRVRAGPRPAEPGRLPASPDYGPIDLESHLDRTEQRVARRILPVRARPTGLGSPWAAGHALAAWLRRLLAAHPTSEPRFVDDDLAENRMFLKGLCDGLAGAGDVRAPSFTWSARVGAHHMDQPLLERMRAAGCRSVVVTADAAIERSSSAARPGLDDAERVMRAANRVGVDVVLEVGIGHPGESARDLEVALRRITALSPRRARGGRAPLHTRLVWRGSAPLGPAERRLLEGLGQVAGGPALVGLWLAWRRSRVTADGPLAGGTEILEPGV